MRSFLAALRTLVLPYGRTTGPRIVLDGVNGLVEVYDENGLVGRIDSNGVLVQGDGQFALSGPNGNGIFLLNNPVTGPQILFVGANGITSGVLAFDTTSTPGGFVLSTGGSQWAMVGDDDDWRLEGFSTGTGVQFDAVSAVLRKRIGSAAETWHTPALQNGWTQLAGYNGIAYRRGVEGTVQFKGTIRAGTVADATTLFTLPAGYRPSANVMSGVGIGPTGAGSASARVFIQTNGVVQCYGCSGVTDLSFEGISFSLEG